jgi:hypothetical protein
MSLEIGFVIILSQGRPIEFYRYRLTSVIPIPVSVTCERNWYRFEINNKLGMGFGICWKCNKVSICLISVNIGNQYNIQHQYQYRYDTDIHAVRTTYFVESLLFCCKIVLHNFILRLELQT